VIVNEALSLAIAIFNARKSQIPILDLWRDEVAGALHPDFAPTYFVMLRKALEVGGFHRVFTIVHQPDLWALADARILVENGTCRLADSADVVVGTAQVEEPPHQSADESEKQKPEEKKRKPRARKAKNAEA